ncbi:hypothetical protein BJ165DRAFT_1554234 [Panaeolus papilionaceus]|nr:hypothetical protein BJ165DRAFT_1554234 [Panaeolus papilionaceus]
MESKRLHSAVTNDEIKSLSNNAACRGHKYKPCSIRLTLAQRVWVTDTHTLFFYAYDHSPTSYAFALQAIPYPPEKPQSEALVRAFVFECIYAHIAPIKGFVAMNHDSIPPHLFHDATPESATAWVLSSIKISSIFINGPSSDQPLPIFRICIDPPSNDADSRLGYIAHVCSPFLCAGGGDKGRGRESERDIGDIGDDIKGESRRGVLFFNDCPPTRVYASIYKVTPPGKLKGIIYQNMYSGTSRAEVEDIRRMMVRRPHRISHVKDRVAWHIDQSEKGRTGRRKEREGAQHRMRQAQAKEWRLRQLPEVEGRPRRRGRGEFRWQFEEGMELSADRKRKGGGMRGDDAGFRRLEMEAGQNRRFGDSETRGEFRGCGPSEFQNEREWMPRGAFFIQQKEEKRREESRREQLKRAQSDNGDGVGAGTSGKRTRGRLLA